MSIIFNNNIQEVILIPGYNLTATTKVIMDYIWTFPEGTSFRKIYKHFTEEEGRSWKRQTLYTYLTILMDQGFLRTEGTRRRTVYIPAISLDDYRQYHAKEILQASYDNSLVKFIAALNGGNTISNKEADELIAMLNEIRE